MAVYQSQDRDLFAADVIEDLIGEPVKVGLAVFCLGDGVHGGITVDVVQRYDQAADEFIGKARCGFILPLAGDLALQIDVRMDDRRQAHHRESRERRR